MLRNHAGRVGSSGFPAHWAEQAIALAAESRWLEAVVANKHILSVAPDDVNALNRLGRASMEVGQYEGARDAYARTLVLSPSNTIAQKNLARVVELREEVRPEAAVE